RGSAERDARVRRSPGGLRGRRPPAARRAPHAARRRRCSLVAYDRSGGVGVVSAGSGDRPGRRRPRGARHHLRRARLRPRAPHAALAGRVALGGGGAGTRGSDRAAPRGSSDRRRARATVVRGDAGGGMAAVRRRSRATARRGLSVVVGLVVAPSLAACGDRELLVFDAGVGGQDGDGTGGGGSSSGGRASGGASSGGGSSA